MAVPEPDPDPDPDPDPLDPAVVAALPVDALGPPAPTGLLFPAVPPVLPMAADDPDGFLSLGMV